MQQTASAPARGTLSARHGASRKLLQRKAVALAETSPAEPALEDSFPAGEGRADGGGDAIAPAGEPAAAGKSIAIPEPPITTEPDKLADAASELESAPLDAAAPPPAHAPAAAPAWSSEDESALQAMLARRRAAGYQPSRGKDVSAQLIRPGAITPNPGTVVALIVGIVAERGAVRRGALLDLMAAAAMPHAKARPQDRGWCQGYVAGAIRDGFLVLASEPAESDASIDAIESSIVEPVA